MEPQLSRYAIGYGLGLARSHDRMRFDVRMVGRGSSSPLTLVHCLV